jgi:chromosome segregation ATPase
MTETKPATVSRPAIFGGLIVLAIGIVAGGIFGASITQKAKEFETRLLAISSDLEKLRVENASLRTALGELETETGNLRSHLEETGKENRALRDSLAKLQKEAGQLKGGLDSVKQENTELASSLEKERQRIDGNAKKLEIFAAEAKEAKTERSLLSQKGAELEKRLADDGKKMIQLGDAVSSLWKNDEELQQRIEAGFQQIGAHGERLAQEAKKLVELAVAMETVKKNVVAGSGDREASAKDREAIRTDLKVVSQKLNTAQTTMDKLVEALSTLGT